MDRVELARRLGAEPRLAEAADAVVEAREPAAFRAALAEAVAGGGAVFLADPAWGERERGQFAARCGRRPVAAAEEDGRGWLCIPTGGSSGAMKLARHDEMTLGAAVRGFVQHFGVERVNAVGLLPLHHVSGLMGWLRCELTGGRHVATTLEEVAAGRGPEPGGGGEWFVSLVPTQLQRLLGDAATEAWLRQFRAVLVGGAAAWPELVERAAAARLPVSWTYGATETAAMVTALRPEAFLAGARGCGPALPHARVAVAGDGALTVDGPSLFRGYWPDWRPAGPWATGDRGRWDERGGLRVEGRLDALINSGGEKVDPAEVEAVLRATGEFDDVAVVGVPDAQWGERVVAAFPAGGRGPELARVEAALRAALAPWKRPKQWLAVPAVAWPRNAQGKVNRAALRVRAAEEAGQDDRRR